MAPTVFISYTHDSPAHEKDVWDLCERLRHDGIDCRIDQHLVSPPEGWPRWCRNQIQESTFVLVVCSAIYSERFEGKAQGRAGLGGHWEGFVITQELYEAQGKNKKFIPVVVSIDDLSHIPLELRSGTHYNLRAGDGYELLFRHLTDQPIRQPSPVAPKLRQMVTLKSRRSSTGSIGNAGAAAGHHVYALGTVEARFPSPAVEKEFMQVLSRVHSSGLSDRQHFHYVLTQPESRHLLSELCWVLTIGGYEAYILRPANPAEFLSLVEALRSTVLPTDVHVIVGTRGSIASSGVCNGLLVPIVEFDQLFSFDRMSLIKASRRPKGIKPAEFRDMVESIIDRIFEMTHNAGVTDEERALNYVAVRYPAIYACAADEYLRGFALESVEVRPLQRFTGDRKIVDVILLFVDSNTRKTERFGSRVDVTEKLPFLVTKLSPYA
jgi:hypothetical protein